jgi:hypothetical protein
VQAGVDAPSYLLGTPVVTPVCCAATKTYYADEEGVTMADKTVVNGVNVEALLRAREALTNAPAGAKFTWRAN